MEDLQIIELYFARDEHAIKETDSKYGKLCYWTAKNILINNEDSEECVNDTYLTLWNKIPPTRPNNFTAFICRITRNLSLKKLVFWTQQGYMPMQAGSKYILFLKAYPDDSDFAGKYFPIDLEYGKYVIPFEFPGGGIEALSNNRQKLEIGEATE